MIISTLKLLSYTALVLCLSQMPVQDKRICDHVGDFLNLSAIHKPLNWISKKLGSTFTIGHHKKNLFPDRAAVESPAVREGFSKSDRARLSALLKKE